MGDAKTLSEPQSSNKRWDDLQSRVLTAVAIMLATGLCIYFGGLLWISFVSVLTLILLREWYKLVRHKPPFETVMWSIFGLIYIGLNAYFLIYMRERPKGISTLYFIILGVVITDTGAYFAGRFVGGKKIAPKISPSKTWAGLFGGAFGAAFTFMLVFSWVKENSDFLGTLEFVERAGFFELNLWGILVGIVLAVVAQIGDFFESWMKRSAGVKDSGNLLPGHGGIFDRVDGLLAVTFLAGSAEYLTSILPV